MAGRSNLWLVSLASLMYGKSVYLAVDRTCWFASELGVDRLI